MRRRVAAAAVVALAVGGLLAACTSAASPVPSRPAASALDERDQIVPSTPDAGPAVQQQTPTEVPNTTGIDGALAWDSAADGSAGALQAFIDTFRASRTYSPEYGAPVDGVPVRTGGRPAMDGGAVPDLDGTAAG